MATKNISFRLPVSVTKQGKRFVAYTHALDISTSGRTEKEAKERFFELASLFFEEITEAGTTHDVLSELGWQKVKRMWAPPKVVSSRSIGFTVPVVA